jgi:hypothetical protein
MWGPLLKPFEVQAVGPSRHWMRLRRKNPYLLREINREPARGDDHPSSPGLSAQQVAHIQLLIEQAEGFTAARRRYDTAAV